MSFNKNKKIGQEAKRIAHSAESHGMSAVGWRKTAHDYGKAAAKSKASQKLKKMAKKVISKPPSGRVNRLEGYVDSRGKRKYDIKGMSPAEKTYHKKNKNAVYRGDLN